MGTPCTSWSKARRGGAGPPALRDSGQGFYGLPGLSAADAQRALLGSRLMKVSAPIAQHSSDSNVRW
eukprot:6199154-Pyramimonas_sp.AAC.1